MTTTTTPRSAWTPRALDDDARQLLAVLMMAVVAFGLGLVMMARTVDQTRAVELRGVRAAIPAGWIVRQGLGDVLLVASDPRQPAVRYGVSKPGGGAADQADMMERRLAARSGLLPAFSVLERGQTSVDGRAGEQVTFTWAGAEEGQPVRSMEGRDLALPDDDSLLVITLESPTDGFDAALPGFERFAASVEEVGP